MTMKATMQKSIVVLFLTLGVGFAKAKATQVPATPLTGLWMDQRTDIPLHERIRLSIHEDGSVELRSGYVAADETYGKPQIVCRIVETGNFMELVPLTQEDKERHFARGGSPENMASLILNFQVTRVRLATGAPQDPLCTEDIKELNKYLVASMPGYIRGIHLNISDDQNTITSPWNGIGLARH